MRKHLYQDLRYICESKGLNVLRTFSGKRARGFSTKFIVDAKNDAVLTEGQAIIAKYGFKGSLSWKQGYGRSGRFNYLHLFISN